MKYLRTRLREHLTLEKFYQAHSRASRNKQHNSEVLRFNTNLTANLLNIMDIIGSGCYQPSNYRRFWVHDPKERLILALPYPDRIVHQWYIEEFIKPYYIPRFIRDSYACIPGRGSHAAVDKTQRYMRTMNRQYDGQYYILKMDIAKFFNHIDPEILFSLLSSRIADAELLNLTRTIIFDGDVHDGIPIGNYVSQYFANIYINELDQFCKHQLGIKYYIRYMDDFVAMADNKAQARTWFELMNQFVNEQLNLQLNPKSRYYPASHGLEFVGYRIYNDFRLIRRRSKNKIHEIIMAYEGGDIDRAKFVERVNSWYGHVKHADTYRYVNSVVGVYREILPVIYPRPAPVIDEEYLRYC